MALSPPSVASIDAASGSDAAYLLIAEFVGKNMVPLRRSIPARRRVCDKGSVFEDGSAVHHG